jgi:hypothetical protein
MIKLGISMLLLGASTISTAATLRDAESAYDQNRVAEAERMFGAVAADGGASAEDRAGAGIALARIAWMIDGNADASLQRLNAAQATGKAPCDIAVMRTRVLHEAGRTLQAIDLEPALLRGCPDADKRDKIRVNVIGSRLDSAAVAPPAKRQRLLKQATADAARLTWQSGTDGARLRLEAAVLTGDSVGALRAWKDFYWLTSSDAPPALSGFHPARIFSRGLRAGASEGARVDLAILLMRAGFADALGRLVTFGRFPNASQMPKWKLVQAYLHQRKQLTDMALQVNRSLARGGSKDDKRLQQAAVQGLGELMAAAGAQGDPKTALAQNYGLVGSVGLTSGYPSLHLGHLVEDRTQTVRQYGHQAGIRFQIVDNMWANGFESWLWDGSAEAGGWSGDGTIIQVRSAYTSGPASAYTLVGETAARKKIETELPRLAAEDLAKARSGAPATLAGLNARLRLQIVDQVATAARKTKGKGDFRRAFLKEYWRANNQQSIFVHEGRHAIDKAMAADPAKLDDATLEYQANLSELALSDYPRMALWNLNHGIGGSTPHEQSSTRIIAALAAWAEAHRKDVAGYDPASPAAVQIDKLTDDQIREVARSLDPLAPK